jgi:predicted HAD superfamily Cof-like phosphohydrolase
MNTQHENVLARTAEFGTIAYSCGITAKNQQTQLGVHFEEVAEMLATLKSTDTKTAELIFKAHCSLNFLATHLKGTDPGIVQIIDRLDFLDSICDQLVTATLSAVLYSMDPVGGLHEVNRSNYSKLTNGVMEKAPVTAKWVKGPDYTPPDLTPFI